MDCIILITLAFLLPMINECPFICQKRYQNGITDNILCHWRLQNKFSSVLTLTGERKRTGGNSNSNVVIEGNSLNY